MTIILLIGIVFAVSIVLVDRQLDGSSPVYSEALTTTDDRMFELPVSGENSQEDVFRRFASLWNNLTVEGIDEQMDSVYAEDVWFNDTVKTITDRATLRHYLRETAQRVAACRVQIDDISRSSGNYYVRWRMVVVPKDTPEHEAWHSIGITHVRFNHAGQIILHQDYWDSGTGLYEHLPVVGWMIRNIKARL